MSKQENAWLLTDDSMNTSPALTKPASCWNAYAKSVAFLLPALVAWWFSAVFLFPKLQQIWSDTGFSEPAFITTMRLANLLLANGGGYWQP